jgi:hypothetical protein
MFHRLLTSQDFFVREELNLLKKLGFCYASFGFKELETQRVFGCFSDPNWAQVYTSKNFFNHDPLAQTACAVANHKILWSAVSIDSVEGYRVMVEREAISGARSGVTLAINDGHIQEIIAIGDSAREDIFLNRFIKCFTQIQEVRRIVKNVFLDGK